MPYLSAARAAPVLVFLFGAHAAAMVGETRPPADDATRATVLLVGSKGTSCTGVAIARDLVLTAAHCVLPGADYKLVEFDAARTPCSRTPPRLRAIPSSTQRRRCAIASPPMSRSSSSPRRREATPALLAPAGGTIVPGDRFVVAGYGLAVRGDGKSGGTLRIATLIATGQPGSLQLRLVDPATKGERAGLGACTGDFGAPVFRDIGGTLMVDGRGRLVDRPERQRRLRWPHRRHAACALSRLDRRAGGQDGRRGEPLDP